MNRYIRAIGFSDKVALKILNDVVRAHTFKYVKNNIKPEDNIRFFEIVIECNDISGVLVRGEFIKDKLYEDILSDGNALNNSSENNIGNNVGNNAGNNSSENDFEYNNSKSINGVNNSAVNTGGVNNSAANANGVNNSAANANGNKVINKDKNTGLFSDKRLIIKDIIPFIKPGRMYDAVKFTTEESVISDEIFVKISEKEFRSKREWTFLLENKLEFRRICRDSANKMFGYAALSTDGTIILPTESDYVYYNPKSKTIRDNEDLRGNITDDFSLVRSGMKSIGIEPCKYFVIGEIKNVYHKKNKISTENIYCLSVIAYNNEFNIIINEKDLEGEPKPGRRFVGTVFMQGVIRNAAGKKI